ncbi:uncharacterized protein THITE_2113709 [Thermothielavioides terrestris NRRL 8126]|uniref:Secreted protein n=1 Tax=Thermothielavioides terrestris (strain ATCC 38088 / NRRL 8126) TaxID=578455 RepID=G2R3U6_THETT|nr:uncharacterized protein THITE_2113709 [Thermothielavioides terrestris NRRL 8126]AEO66001.1 hypothetical protein THITE_2113709 [Thermothielavioides terrestris NRRL 8126]
MLVLVFVLVLVLVLVLLLPPPPPPPPLLPRTGSPILSLQILSPPGLAGLTSDHSPAAAPTTL